MSKPLYESMEELHESVQELKSALLVALREQWHSLAAIYIFVVLAVLLFGAAFGFDQLP